jgi:serine O-acetyltransferase
MWADLKADLERYPSVKMALMAVGFWACAMYRLQRALNGVPKALRVPLRILLAPLAFFVRVASGAEIPAGAKIGPGLYIGHFGCIVISTAAVIGERCNLSQGVTIGAGTRKGIRGAPVIGDRVYIAPGAKIFGPITVGSDSAVGANAVVNDDVPSGVSVAGIPARVVSDNGSRGLLDLQPAPPQRLAG